MKILIASTALLLSTSAFAAAPSTLTGQWSLHQSISGNESDQDCKFVQSADNKLTGRCKSDDKEVQITGNVDGTKVTWKYVSDYNGSPLTLTYSATLDDPDKIKGSVDVQPFGVTGEFTATPSKGTGK